MRPSTREMRGASPPGTLHPVVQPGPRRSHLAAPPHCRNHRARGNAVPCQPRRARSVRALSAPPCGCRGPRRSGTRVHRANRRARHRGHVDRPAATQERTDRRPPRQADANWPAAAPRATVTAPDHRHGGERPLPDGRFRGQGHDRAVPPAHRPTCSRPSRRAVLHPTSCRRATWLQGAAPRRSARAGDLRRTGRSGEATPARADWPSAPRNGPMRSTPATPGALPGSARCLLRATYWRRSRAPQPPSACSGVAQPPTAPGDQHCRRQVCSCVMVP